MSGLERIADLTQTLRDVREGPQADVSCEQQVGSAWLKIDVRATSSTLAKRPQIDRAQNFIPIERGRELRSSARCR